MRTKKIKHKELPLLTQIIRVRGIRMQEVREALHVSQPTVNKFLSEPKYMNGIHRAALAKLLSLKTDTMDELCAGLLNRIGEILEI